MEESFDIYSTANGLIQVSNPVRRQILTHLLTSDLSLTDISNITGKAQSTLSVHLEKMASDALVVFRDDPADSRRKIFSLSSKLMARSRDVNNEGLEAYYKTLETVTEKDCSFFKVIMRAMIIGAEASGLCIGAAMRQVGKNIGTVLAKKIKSTKVEDIISELQEFYEKNGIGEVCVYTFMPLTIIVRDNYELTHCAAESISMFSQGVFITVLQELTKKRYRIAASECFGASNNYSKFVIEQII
ncbi:MAG: ArsR family transcriptional regulator [Methanomassiliicoccaceae archaeon]|jgi:predicted hydrocarbon binding protein|nr:ArsR family transcriptional regulator [Methanomassiliicoccaceae archaeon]